jgi:hypothetical protein
MAAPQWATLLGVVFRNFTPRMDRLGLAGLPDRRHGKPQRMGTALTYARRYSLFPLVGIAGEDDLDAPDLCHPGSSSTATPPARSAGNGRDRAFGKATPPVLLGATLSASLREMLLGEIAAITSSALAVRWAQDALPRKNSLTAADAKLVEDAFEAQLSELTASEGAAPMGDQRLPTDTGPVPDTSVAQRVVPDVGATIGTAKASESNSATPVDKSVLAIAAPRRYRNREHLHNVSKKPCLRCGLKLATRIIFGSRNRRRWAAR